MAGFSLAMRSTVSSSGAAVAEIRAAASNRVRLFEVGVSIQAATASLYGLGRPASAGTASSAVAVLPDDTNDTGTAQGAVTWSSGPTAPTQFMRRGGLPASIGAGLVWTFPRGIIIPASGSIVLWNIAAGANAVDVYWVIDE